MGRIKYSIVVPVFNEEEVIKESYRRLNSVMNELNETYELIFINDGSRDNTMSILKGMAKDDNALRIIDFSRNFGHQPAITAGMNHSSGDAIVVIDADLQDPPEIIPKMIEKWKEGFDVVYGKRAKRKGETIFKRVTAKAFYRLLDVLTEVNIPVDVGDFRLIDRKVCNALNQLPEKDRYVRGLVSWLGFKQTDVTFIREERFAGETKYPLSKMAKFATDGLTSFSYKPLKLATYLGMLMSLFSFSYLIYILYLKFFTDATIVGWSSLMGLSSLFNGIVLIMLGIIGEYIGRIYNETKNRPIYVVNELVNFNMKEESGNATE